MQTKINQCLFCNAFVSNKLTWTPIVRENNKKGTDRFEKTAVGCSWMKLKSWTWYGDWFPHSHWPVDVWKGSQPVREEVVVEGAHGKGMNTFCTTQAYWKVSTHLEIHTGSVCADLTCHSNLSGNHNQARKKNYCWKILENDYRFWQQNNC